MKMIDWIRRMHREIEDAPETRDPDDPSVHEPHAGRGPNATSTPGASTPFHAVGR